MNIDHNFFKLRQKRYLHFDQPISSEKVFNYVCNAKNIVSHSFYPFIHFELKLNKIQKVKKIINGVEKKVVEKKPPKIRPIKYCSHMDGHIYAYYSLLMSEKYEEHLVSRGLNNSVLAFRKLPNSPSNIHFAKMVFDEIRFRKNCTVICLDIKSFFDELDHGILKKSWCKILDVDKLPDDHYKVFKSIAKYSYVNKGEVYRNLNLSINSQKLNLRKLCSGREFRDSVRNKGLVYKNELTKGIPQGSPISAFLSNIYMLDFDENVYRIVDRIGGKYYRYCDDIIVIADGDKNISLMTDIQREINKIKLEIQTSKTELIKFENGTTNNSKKLQYLGFTFDGEKVLLRDAGLAKYSHKTMKAVKMMSHHVDRINNSRAKRKQDNLKLNKKSIYRRFSYIGKRNYISYALRASMIMEEPAIKKQIKPHWRRLKKHLDFFESTNSSDD